MKPCAKSNRIFWRPILILHFGLLVEPSRTHVRATHPNHPFLFNLLLISPSLLLPTSGVKEIYFLGCKVTWPRAKVFFSFLFDGDCDKPPKSLVNILVQKFMVKCANMKLYVLYVNCAYMNISYTHRTCSSSNYIKKLKKII
jgi:hypothetical protein